MLVVLVIYYTHFVITISKRSRTLVMTRLFVSIICYYRYYFFHLSNVMDINLIIYGQYKPKIKK